MLRSKTHEIILISYDVCGAGHCCEEVAGAKLNAWHLPPSLRCPQKHGENASFGYNFCASRSILKILTALEIACLVPELIKLSRYEMTYMARGVAAKKLRHAFNF